MKTLSKLLQTYETCHKNPVNEIIHLISIPLIMLGILGGLYFTHPLVALFFVVFCMFYYLRLSFLATLLMVLWVTCCILVLRLFEDQLLMISIQCFIIGWVGQAIGHFIEGKRPSFFDDLCFLLIGPLFVINVLTKKMGINIFKD